MASEEELRKINVRSPYFVNVTKPVSEGGVESDDTGGGEEPFVEPTEPTVTTTTISCGDTRNIGFGVGVNRYEFSTIGKQIGDYDINFSNIKVPFYAKIGIKGNMPSEYTFMVGHSGYDSNWLDAVGTPVPSSTTISSHPDGNDQTITYTSTQSDIDTYGETVLLEVFHPVINIENINFTVNCPNAVVSVAEDSGQQSVFILTIKNDTILPEYLTGAATNRLNDEEAPWLTFPDQGKYKTYVFGNYTPNLKPVNSGNFKHLNSDDLIEWDNPSKHEIVYRPASDLYNNQNVFQFYQNMKLQDQALYKVWFSKHRISLVTDATRNNDEAFETYQSVPDYDMNIHTVSRLTQEGTNYWSGLGEKIYISQLLPVQTFVINTTGLVESQDNPNSNHLIESSVNIKTADSVMNETYKLVPHNDAQFIELWTSN